MKKPGSTLREFRRQYPMHIFVWCGMLFLLLFSLIPMLGLVISFNNYKIKTGFAGMFTGPWVGFKNFADFLGHRKFGTLVRNTLSISVLKLIFAFPLPIFFAIIITEMRGKVFKRLVQTASYLPHFISWTIVAGILHAFFSTNTGMINEVLMNLGLITEPVPVLISEEWYYTLAVVSEMWKETGWNAIIYLAAIAGIDPTLYESAQIDGAGRLKRIWHITLPCILPTIAVLLTFTLLARLEHQRIRRDRGAYYVEMTDIRKARAFYEELAPYIAEVEIVPAKSGLPEHVGMEVITSTEANSKLIAERLQTSEEVAIALPLH